MPTFPISDSLRSFWRELVSLEASLSAYEQTAPLAARVTAHIESYDALEQEEREAQRKALQIGSQMRVGDMLMDRALRSLQSDVLGAVKQNRAAPAYARLFGEGIREVTKYALTKQIEVARDKVKTLRESQGLYSAELVAEHVEALEETIRAGQAIVEARRSHEIATADLRLRVEDWKHGANAVMMGVEGQLLELASTEGEKRAWAKAFFM